MSGGLVGRVEQLLEATEELRSAAQAWADGKPILFDTDSRLVEAVNAELAAVNLVEPLARDWQRLIGAITGEGIDYTPEMLRDLAATCPDQAKWFIEGCAEALAAVSPR